MSTNNKTIIPAITGIRAVAAGMVFFYHWFFHYAASFPLLIRAPFEVGYVGVPIFFALSGFLIAVRYADDLRRKKVSYGRYLWKRLVRIYPLYFFILVFLVFALGRPISVVPTDLRGILVSFTITQALFPSLVLIATTTGWTLTIEAMYYIIAPPLILLLNRQGRLANMLGRAFWVSVFSIFLGFLLAELPLPTFLPDTLLGAEFTYIMHYSLLGHLPDFLAGMVVGLMYLQREKLAWINHRANLLIWLSSIGIFGAVIVLDMTNAAVPYGAPINRFLGFVTAMFSATLILGLAGDKSRQHPVSRFLGSRILVYLGATSYALYLVQLTEPLQWLYWVFLGEWLGVDGRIWRAILLYLMAIPISALLYELVERPSHRCLSRRFYSKLAQA